jgi:hypothetical protein
MDFNNESLLEIAYDRLEQNAEKKLKPGRKERASDVTLTNTVFIPYFNDNYLEIESKSRTTNGSYISRIVFENVVFRDEEMKDSAKIMTPDGSEYYFKPINRKRAQVKVSCTCLDFYYRFAQYNHRDDALASDPPKPYVKKTDRAPVNPAEVSGVCKHLIRMVEELEKDNVFSAGWFQSIKNRIFGRNRG